MVCTPTYVINTFRPIRFNRNAGDTHRTTIRLEQNFWDEIDHQAGELGLTWADWVTKALATKPQDIGSASWLRVTCLTNRKGARP